MVNHIEWMNGWLNGEGRERDHVFDTSFVVESKKLDLDCSGK